MPEESYILSMLEAISIGIVLTAILSEQATKRAATRTTIKPDHNLFASIMIAARKEPEVELSRLIRSLRDWEKASIGFADVEVDIWKS